MNVVKPTEMKWEKLRLDQDTRNLLDRAATELHRISGGKFHVIRQPFGKIIGCRSGALLFFHAGDGGRPPEIVPVAVTNDPESRLLLPTQRAEDFDECCELLGYREDAERDRFRSFLLPRSTSRGGLDDSLVRGAETRKASVWAKFEGEDSASH